MRNLLIFISKYNAFFMFAFFEIGALIILVNYNSFQKATYISSSNQVTGGIYGKVNDFSSYLSLGAVNDSLMSDNARLRNLLKSSFYADTLAKHKVNDTVYKQQYTYIGAKVINNSINHRNNYITINRGSNDGIETGMGVICSSGVAGMVVNVTAHLANVQSVLHKNTIVSAMMADTKDLCTFKWADDMNPTKGLLYDLSASVKPHVGELVVTSGYSSFFPQGIAIGKISKLNGRGSPLDVALGVDFSKLDYVYVINNKLANEQAQLEVQRKKDE